MPPGGLAELVAGARDAVAARESGGQVVRLGSHPRYAADFKPLAGQQVAAARTALCLGHAEFAALLEDALGWTVMPETVARWETESVPPGDVVLFCQAYLTGALGGSQAAPGGGTGPQRDDLTARRAAKGAPVNDLSAYDPATVPAWARESIARIARDQPESLPHWLEHVAEVEDAKQRTAAHPPAPTEDPRDFLHLLAIQAWHALASGQPTPAPDPMFLEQEISDAFGGNSPVDQLCDDWLNAARERGITVDDEDGEILPDVLEPSAASSRRRSGPA